MQTAQLSNNICCLSYGHRVASREHIGFPRLRKQAAGYSPNYCARPNYLGKANRIYVPNTDKRPCVAIRNMSDGRLWLDVHGYKSKNVPHRVMDIIPIAKTKQPDTRRDHLIALAGFCDYRGHTGFYITKEHKERKQAEHRLSSNVRIVECDGVFYKIIKKSHLTSDQRIVRHCTITQTALPLKITQDGVTYTIKNESHLL